MWKHIFQLRTKKEINSMIGPGFIFTVPSMRSFRNPTDDEIKAVLNQKFGQGAGDRSSFDSFKYEVLA